MDYQGLFGHMCEFRTQPPLLFAVPDYGHEMYRRIAYYNAPVELVVPNLDAFCVPEEDLPRIQSAVDAALNCE